MKNLSAFSVFLIVSLCAMFFLASTPKPVPVVAGEIVGKITYDNKAPQKKRINLAEFPDCAAEQSGVIYYEDYVIGRNKGLANVIIRIVNPPKKKYNTPTQAKMVNITGCRFSPHVIAVKNGQPMGFKNSDGILHNVHGLPNVNKGFNMGMPPSMTSKSMSFASPEGPFNVKCDVHPWMNAYVAVMTHPYFAVTGSDGTYSIKTPGLLAGVVYEIEAWHERLGVRKGTVEVGEGTVSFSLSFK